MNVVGRVGSFITQGVYSVATPFHPFGGAVDIIVVKQHDGTFRSTPWYVRFGKFQGVLKGAENLVRIEVNGVEANFDMHLDNSGEAYFVSEVTSDEDVDKSSMDPNNFGGGRGDNSISDSNAEDSENLDSDEVEVQDERVTLGMTRLERTESDCDRIFYDFQDDPSSPEGSVEYSEYGSSRYDTLDSMEHTLEQSEDLNSEVVLVSVDGHILTAPLSSSERNAEDVQESMPQFHLGPGKGLEEYNTAEAMWSNDHLHDFFASPDNNGDKATDKSLSSKHQLEPCERGEEHLNFPQETDLGNLNRELCIDGCENTSSSLMKSEVFKSCLELQELALQSAKGDQKNAGSSLQTLDLTEDSQKSPRDPLTNDERGNSEMSTNDDKTESQVETATHEKNTFGTDYDQELQKQSEADLEVVKMNRPEQNKDDSVMASSPSSRWRLWQIPFRRANTLERNNSSSEVFLDSESVSESQVAIANSTARITSESPRKKIIRTNVPTTEQIASLNLKEGQNMVDFIFSTRVLGSQKVEAHIYLWKWNTRIVISDVDGTITKSDVLGQFMPLVGKDWTHSGIARLFSAIKENGYQLLFLSARAIVQSYLTKSFLFNLKQDGNSLPTGPVVISPDGLFPSLYREVIRRAPHEFKIACLEDIKALFPPGYNPFYAGFGNRDTDELSYRKIGIPKGKIFIINPKGEVAINNRIDVKSYTSLHTLVHDMFPPTSLVNETLMPTSLVEQEDYNSWNFWKMPLPDVVDL